MMPTNSLRMAPLFSELDDETLRYFIEGSQSHTYNKDQEIFALGDPADALCFICEGWVRLYRMNRNGGEITINVFGPHESFGEAAVFSRQRRYPVNAQAADRTVLLHIPRQLFIDRMQSNRDFSLQLLCSVSSRYRMLVQQLEQITVRTPPQHLGTFLLHLCPMVKNGPAEISLPYEKALIARRLNIEPETFSRAIKKLEPFGVTVSGRMVSIADIEKLRTYCEIDENYSFD